MPRSYYRVFEGEDRYIAVVWHIYELARLRDLLRRIEKPMRVYLFSLEESVPLEDIL